MSAIRRQPDPAVEWSSVVKEAMRRRKTEKMSQRQHAQLAGVSVPTMAAFERGDLSLSLAKAFDILRVVGMVDEPEPETAQDRFVRETLLAWQAMDAARIAMPTGYFWMDYWLDGPVRIIDQDAFDQLRQRIDRHNPVLSSFWRSESDGRFCVVQPYREDALTSIPPGTVLDLALPVQYLARMILHAASLARHMHRPAKGAMMIRFRAHFAGLKGRKLQALAYLQASLPANSHLAEMDDITLGADIPVEDMPDRLTGHIYPMIDRLYELFGIGGTSEIFVEDEIRRLRLR